jgi:hypothetical protein
MLSRCGFVTPGFGGSGDLDADALAQFVQALLGDLGEFALDLLRARALLGQHLLLLVAISVR